MFGGTFGGMWYWSMKKGKGRSWGYEEAAVQSFTAASNNFVSAVDGLKGDLELIPLEGAVNSSLRGSLWGGLGSSISSDHWTAGGSTSITRINLVGDLSW
jgi:hypothetical protein